MENIVLPQFPSGKGNVTGDADSPRAIIGTSTSSFPQGTRAWFDDSSWMFIRAEHRRSKFACRARNALARAYHDNFLCEQTLASHPLSLEWRMRYGRYAIFRLGAALAKLGSSDETETRLRDPRQYRACAAELDFGLFLATTGALVRHEPLKPARGPDFSLNLPFGVFGFEVKSPTASASFAARAGSALRFASELQRLAPQVPGKRGWVVEARAAAERWCSLVHEESLSETIRATDAHLRGWSRRPREIELCVEPGISLSVRRGAASGVQVWGPTFVGDVESEASRLLHVHAQRVDGSGKSAASRSGKSATQRGKEQVG
jgi:hypothetical protein